MHHQALFLGLLSVTPLLAAPLPQHGIPIITVTDADATATAIKARAAVGSTLEYPPFGIVQEGDFIKRGNTKLSYAPVYSPLPDSFVKRDEIKLSHATVDSPSPDSFVKRQEAEAAALEASWDPYCIPGGTNCGLDVAATAIKRSEPPVMLPKGATVAIQEGDFVKRDEIKLSHASVDSPSPDSFVKRQEAEAAALEASWDPYCIPGGTNCGLDATATAIKRQESEAEAVAAAWDPYCIPGGTNCGLDVAVKEPATALKRGEAPGPDARMDATALKRGESPEPDARMDATALKRGEAPEPDARMDATAIKRQAATVGHYAALGVANEAI